MTDQELIAAALRKLSGHPAAAEWLGADLAARLPELSAVAASGAAGPYELFFGRGLSLEEIAQRLGGEARQYAYLLETPAPGQGELAALRAELRGAQVAEQRSTQAARRASACADRLAYAAFSVDDIGEHTTSNNPWTNAAERLETLTARGVLATGGVAALADTWEQRAEAQPGAGWNTAAHELRTALRAAPQEQPLTGWTALHLDGDALLGVPPQGGPAREIGTVDSLGLF